jgi:membrane protein insertase Oxa1/YidC/SpoIIIJ
VAGLETYALATIPVWGQFVDLLRAILSLLIGLTGSPGLAIILFTVAIRALLVPLTVQAHRANRRMQALQPQLRALQKRYRKDRQKLSAETLRLYREHRIKPFANILPALVQIPLLLGLYQVIVSVSTAGGGIAQGFLWLPRWPTPIPGTSCRSWLSSSSCCKRGWRCRWPRPCPPTSRSAWSSSSPSSSP